MDRTRMGAKMSPSEMAQLARMEKGSARNEAAQGRSLFVPPKAQVLAFGAVHKCTCGSDRFVAETLVTIQFTDLAKTQASLTPVGSRFKCAGCGATADLSKKDEKATEQPKSETEEKH